MKKYSILYLAALLLVSQPAFSGVPTSDGTELACSQVVNVGIEIAGTSQIDEIGGALGALFPDLCVGPSGADPLPSASEVLFSSSFNDLTTSGGRELSCDEEIVLRVLVLIGGSMQTRRIQEEARYFFPIQCNATQTLARSSVQTIEGENLSCNELVGSEVSYGLGNSPMVTDVGGELQQFVPNMCNQSAVPPQCSDGIDNDGDGDIDLSDAGCDSSADNDESDSATVYQCSDGIDNDGDGLVDLSDSGCNSAFDNDEYNAPPPSECSDGLDNDGDGYVDGNDPGCSDGTESPFNSSNPNPNGTPVSSCRTLTGGNYYLSQDIYTSGYGCITGSGTLDLNGHRAECGGSRDQPCVDFAGVISNGSIYMNAEGNPDWPNNFGGPAVWSGESSNLTLTNVEVHCEANLKNVDYGCVQNRYSGRLTLNNTQITNDAGQCLHATGGGDISFQGSGSTCQGEPIFFYDDLSGGTFSPQGYWVISGSQNVTLDAWNNSNGGLITGSSSITVMNGTANGIGIVTINGGNNILLQSNTISGGGADYWSAAIQCRSEATNVRLVDNIVTGMGFAYYGYAPGAGCPGVVIDGGSYTAGNNDAIMCRRCPNLSIRNATLNGRLRTHANLGAISASNVTINPRGGLHLDLRSQESFGPGPTTLTVSGGNGPWSCTGTRCGAVNYQ